MGTTAWKATLAAALSAVAFCADAGAADALRWARLYGGGGNSTDEGRRVIVTDNLVIAGGLVRDETGFDNGEILCYDLDGRLVWRQEIDFGMGDDFLEDLIADGAGNLYATGYAMHDGDGNASIMAMKMTTGGKILWTRRFLPAGYTNIDIPVRTALLNGVLYVTATARTAAGNADIYLAEVQPNGTVSWDNVVTEFTAGGADRGRRILADGGFLVAAGTVATDNGSAMFVRNIDASAKDVPVWDSIILPGGTSTEMTVVDVAVSGASVLLAGIETDPASGISDPVLVRIDRGTGAESWRRSVGASTFQPRPGLKVTVSAGVILFTGAVFEAGGSTLDSFLRAYDDNGALLWSTTFGIPGQDDRPAFIGVDATGRIAVGGSYAAAGASSLSHGVRYFGPDGADRGSLNAGPLGGGGGDRMSDGLIDPDGNVYFTGSSLTVGAGSDFAVGRIGPSSASSGAAGGGGCLVVPWGRLSGGNILEQCFIFSPAVLMALRKAIRAGIRL